MKQKNTSFKWIGAIVAVAIVLVVALPMIGPSAELEGNEIEVKSGDLSTYYGFSGTIEAKNRQTIFAEQAIQITEFKVAVGDVVQKDDILYSTNRGIDVRSKIDGEVLSILVQEDEQLMPGAEIITVVDYDELQLKVKVDEYDLETIKKDTPVSISIHALNDEFEGTVVDISKEGTNVNGATFFDAVVSVENSEGILVGMSAEAKVLNESATDIAILPVSAVNFRDDNSPYVNIKKDGKLEEKDVELGITDGINVEIKSGVSAKDKVFVAKEETSNMFGPRGPVNSGGEE